MRSVFTYLRTAFTALRMLLVFTVLLGIGYPLAITAIAQIPGLQSRADGSVVTQNGADVGSSEIGQSFTDSKGSCAAAVLPVPPLGRRRRLRRDRQFGQQPRSRIRSSTPCPTRRSKATRALQSLLTEVCTRSLASASSTASMVPVHTAARTGPARSWPCSGPGPGYRGHITRAVKHQPGSRRHPVHLDLSRRPGRAWPRTARITPRARSCPSAVTHPHTRPCPRTPSPPRAPGSTRTSARPTRGSRKRVVAKTRGITVAQVAALVSQHTSRAEGWGSWASLTVNVLKLNLALDRQATPTSALGDIGTMSGTPRLRTK